MAKEKKEKTEIKLPKAWTTLKHRNETSQARETYEDMWKFIGALVLIAVVLFVLLGGINQRKFWETLKTWGNNVGSAIAGIFNLGDIEVNDDGVYLNLDGSKSSGVEGSDVSDPSASESSQASEVSKQVDVVGNEAEKIATISDGGGSIPEPKAST